MRVRSFAGLLALVACTAEVTSAPAGGASGSGGSTVGSGGGGTTGSAANAGLAGDSGSAAAGAGGSGTGGSGGASSTTDGSGGSGAEPSHPPPKSPTASLVYVDGRRLMVGKRLPDGGIDTPAPYRIKGVSWSPTGVGETNEDGYAGLYTKYVGGDSELVRALNANTVKTYGAFETNASGRAVLDQLYQRGVMVIMSVITSHGSAEGKRYLNAVNSFKDHPGILFWVVGNEFNYNSLYGAGSFTEALRIVNTAIDDIHAADPDHPVAVSHGEMPSAGQYGQIPNADLWSINLYPALNFAQRFDHWIRISHKPMFVGEYGADAYDNRSRSENQAAQADAIDQLTRQIAAQYSADDPARSVLGGTPFTLSDEWWKAEGEPDRHDSGGFANAVHPDNFANEEWWGLCAIDRTPRAAFDRLSMIYGAIP